MSAARKPELTPDQAAYVARARKALDAGTDKNLDILDRLAQRVGSLEWHMGELLALIAELTGGTVGMPAVNAGDEPEGNDEEDTSGRGISDCNVAEFRRERGE
jgi:hypothetical protein